MKPIPSLLLLTFASCVAADKSTLQPGDWVEAKGKLVAGRHVVTEVDGLERTEDDKADKVEVLGEVAAATDSSVEVLGGKYPLDSETEFEDAEKKALDPFVPNQGDWVRLKLRSKATGIRTRTLRKSEPRDEFKVTGELRRMDAALGELDVGGIRLTMAQDIDVGLQGEVDSEDPLALFLADDQKSVPFSLRLGDDWRFGGQVSVNAEWKDEYDLDTSEDGDRFEPEIRAKVDALWLIDDAGSYALFEVAGGRDDTFREESDKEDTHEDSLEVTRAYASLALGGGFRLLAGRQDFDEEREWLYDEILDGARVAWRKDNVELEAAAAAGREVLAEDNDTEDTGLFTAIARMQAGEDWLLTAYGLKRTDDSEDSAGAEYEPLLYGVRSFARPRYGLGHWVEVGGATGEALGKDVNGWAVDVGGLYTFDAALRPAFGLGVAHGSGRSNTDAETGYRQSGLQDNNARMGGVTSVRYYGELLDPELANLTVLTAVVAVRPVANGSVSLLLHNYRQDVAAAGDIDNRTLDLRTVPSGVSRDIGNEVDIVFGYRLQRRLTLELVGGWFAPGNAFDDQDDAHKIEFTGRFSF